MIGSTFKLQQLQLSITFNAKKEAQLCDKMFFRVMVNNSAKYVNENYASVHQVTGHLLNQSAEHH